jgi:hypothetical protein
MSSQLADRLWLAWFLISFLTFLIPELLALLSKHPEWTLSASIWRLESDLWLFCHFIFRKFT